MLSMAIYFLSQHPDVLQRLREEILEKVGSTRRPDYDDIREMKYLRAVINGAFHLIHVFMSVTHDEVCRDITIVPSRVSMMPYPTFLRLTKL